MRGEVVYYSIQDLGARVELERVRDVAGQVPEAAATSVQKAAPPYVELPRPLVAHLPTVRLETTVGPLEVRTTCRVYDVGAVTLQFRVAFQEPGLAELAKYLGLRVVVEEGTLSLREYAARVFGPVRASLQDAMVEPYDVRVAPETYTVIAVTEADLSPRELMKDHRKRLAALLSNEPRADKLSAGEVEDNLKSWFSYYEDDLVVVDWDYAFLYDKEGKYEDVLFVMELANVQLLELRTYDAYLDHILERSYAELEVFLSGKAPLKSPKALVQELSDARIDLTRVADNIENIGKLFGDYYLAKLYLALTERFHIHQWERTVNEKLRTLNELYAMATHEVQSRRALILEAMIVLLFIVDLAFIAVTLK